ncbi:MAG: hypothetical protein J6B94_00150 [Lachnospiraceae bacterium]|nr:hypothetical protein [Lachnospiraceae bacterium]
MSEKHTNKKHGFAWKRACILPVFLIVLTVTTLTVNAYLRWSAVVENVFNAEASVVPAVNETFENNLKTDVSVNSGETEYSVYVRAAIIVTWVNGDGEVHAKVPVLGVDYELDLNVDTDTDTSKAWFEKGGFYYHKDAVESENDTAVLINSCKPLKEAPSDGYTLKVEIITQTIQSAGMTDGEYGDNGIVITDSIPAVTSAWGVTVDADKKLQSN